MSEEQILELIGKKLSGSANPSELEKLEHWTKESQANQQQLHRLRELWVHGKKKLVVKDADEVFDNIIAQTSITTKIEGEPAIKLLWPRLLRIAAVFVFLVVGAFIVYRYIDGTQPEPGQMVVELISKSNPRGQKSTIVLPDGTKVKLNSESYLEYPSHFEGDKREVKLIGEAFFEVTKNPEKPFIVKSGALNVRVLGTSFNVSVNPYDQKSTVAVATGKVAVSKLSENGSDTLIATLLPDEMVSLDHKTNQYEVISFDREQVFGWKDGILVFHNDDYPTIVKKLEKWYGVEFIVAENYKQGNGYTGTFTNATLEKVMDGWSYTSNFSYRIDGKKIYID